MVSPEPIVVEDAWERIVKNLGTRPWINNVGGNHHNAIGLTWDLDLKNWETETSLNLYTMFPGIRTHCYQSDERAKEWLYH